MNIKISRLQLQFSRQLQAKLSDSYALIPISCGKKKETSESIKLETENYNTEPKSLLDNVRLPINPKFKDWVLFENPDNAPGLSINRDYSIQFVNSGTWESTTGYNNLLQTITATTLGVDDFLVNTDVFVHPNPSSDFISIQLKGATKYKIQMYNIKGQLIKE